jgi:hypothetical protein
MSMRRHLRRRFSRLSEWLAPRPVPPPSGPQFVPPPALHVATPEQLGRDVFGPVLFAFMAWLMRHPAVSRLDRLYFSSREGWALEALYSAMRENAGFQGLPPATYLHCSRRAVLAAQMGASVVAGTPLDATLLTSSSPWFEGTVEDLLRARIGFVSSQPQTIPSSPIALMRDAAVVHCVARLMADQIAPHVRQAHAGFTAYASFVGMTQGGHAGLVDVGYSAAIQSAVQKILGIRLVGFYMAATEAARRTGEEGGFAFGAFAEGAGAAQFGGAFGLFLEAVLSALHGQVIGYTVPARQGGTSEPVFAEDGASQRAFKVLERIHAGIRAYCLDQLAKHGLQEPDGDPFAMLRQLGAGAITVAPEIRRALFVEDAFCGNGEIDVLARAGISDGS